MLNSILRLAALPPAHLLAKTAFLLTQRTLLLPTEEKGIGTWQLQLSHRRNGAVYSPWRLEKSSLYTNPFSPHSPHLTPWKTLFKPSSSNNLQPYPSISHSLSSLLLSSFFSIDTCGETLSFFFDAVAALGVLGDAVADVVKVLATADGTTGGCRVDTPFLAVGPRAQRFFRLFVRLLVPGISSSLWKKLTLRFGSKTNTTDQ